MKFNRTFTFSDRLKQAYRLNLYSAVVQELSLCTGSGLVEAHKFFDKVFRDDDIRTVFKTEYQEKDFRKYTSSDFIDRLLESDLVVISPDNQKALYDLSKSLTISIRHFRDHDNKKSLKLAKKLLAKINK